MTCVTGRDIENCERKRTFETKQEARTTAKKHRRAKVGGKSKWSYYRCPVCSLYHLTTRKDARSRRGR